MPNGDFPEYQRVRIENVDYVHTDTRGVPTRFDAADWEYTYRLSGVLTGVLFGIASRRQMGRMQSSGQRQRANGKALDPHCVHRVGSNVFRFESILDGPHVPGDGDAHLVTLKVGIRTGDPDARVERYSVIDQRTDEFRFIVDGVVVATIHPPRFNTYRVGVALPARTNRSTTRRVWHRCATTSTRRCATMPWPPEPSRMSTHATAQPRRGRRG